VHTSLGTRCLTNRAKSASRAVMERDLFLKSSSGGWKAGSGQVKGQVLQWVCTADADNEVVQVGLDEKVHVQRVQFGLRKFVFEVQSGGNLYQFAATSEDDRTFWLKQVFEVSGIEDEEEKEKENAKARKPAPKPLAQGKVSGLQNMLLGLPGGKALGGGMMTEAEATRRLQDKLRGKVVVHELSNTSCVVCKLKVDKSEEIKLDGGQTIHNGCFFCASCASGLSQESGGYFFSEENECVCCSETCLQNFKTKKTGEAKQINDSKGTIQHDALLKRPTVNRGRRKPSRRPGAAATAASVVPPSAEDVGKEVQSRPESVKAKIPFMPSESHENSICFIKKKQKVVLVCERLSEKRTWANVLANLMELGRLQRKLQDAQRVDMYAAIQAQMNIQTFQESHKTSIEGKVFVGISKKASDHVKRWRYVEAKANEREGIIFMHENGRTKPPLIIIADFKDVCVEDAKTGKSIAFIPPVKPVSLIPLETEEEKSQDEKEPSPKSSQGSARKKRSFGTSFRLHRARSSASSPSPSSRRGRRTPKGGSTDGKIIDVLEASGASLPPPVLELAIADTTDNNFQVVNYSTSIEEEGETKGMRHKKDPTLEEARARAADVEISLPLVQEQQSPNAKKSKHQRQESTAYWSSSGSNCIIL